MSDLFKLDRKDFFNGMFFAVGWAFFNWLLDILVKMQGGEVFSIPTFQYLLLSAAIGMLVYLIKRFFSNTEWDLLWK